MSNISKDKFWKPTVTGPTRKMKRRDYKGTRTVRYHNPEVFHKITAIYNCISTWRDG